MPFRRCLATPLAIASILLCAACGSGPRAATADLASIRQPTPDPTLDAVVRDLPRVLAGVAGPSPSPTPTPTPTPTAVAVAVPRATSIPKPKPVVQVTQAPTARPTLAPTARPTPRPGAPTATARPRS